MSTPARIDELRKKFDENPRRYFAPLANEYRKAGDLAQAIALCREFLPNQPGHMSGHIVFGQALYELGLLEESREVFGSALMLDPENLIALRHLGDIAKISGDAAGARRWYERVLDADPRNDDIAAQLATLAAGRSPTAPMLAVSENSAEQSPRSGAHPAFASPASPTPASGVGAGLHALPTPDASMRSVDFDRVNERIAQSTPLYVSALEQPSSEQSVAQPASAFGVEARVPAETTRVIEPLDLDAMDAAPVAEYAAMPDRADGDGVTEQDTAADPAPMEESDASWNGTPAALDASGGEEQHEANEQYQVQDGHERPDASAIIDEAAAPVVNSDVSESTADALNDSFAQVGSAFADVASGKADPSDDTEWADAFDVYQQSDVGTAAEQDDFEDGILAPEWPEASAILASISSPRSRTPISVEITPEAAEAFGREPHEAVHDEEARDVDAVEEPYAAPALADENDAASSIADVAGETTVETRATQHHEASGKLDVHFSDDSPHTESRADDALTVDDEQQVHALHESDETVDADVAVDGMDGIDGVDVADAWSIAAPAVSGTAGDAASAVTSPELDALGIVDSDELEEASVRASIERAENPETSFASVLGEQAEGAAGETGIPTFQALVDDDIGDDIGDDYSFDEDAPGSPSSLSDGGMQPAQSPMFVTETMGELLVSQGFVSRAVEVYDELVRRRPYDPVLTSRLAELRERLVAESIAPEDPEAREEADSDESAPPVEASHDAHEPAYAIGTQQQLEDPVAEQAEMTARELFAALAARRVPRRTPSHAVRAVQSSEQSGLDSLFGNSTATHDDVAARALADAFAPISDEEMATGLSLDLDFGRPAPTAPSATWLGESGDDRGSSPSAPTNALHDSGAPSVARQVTPLASAGFSFDRFFPDPASPRNPTSPSPGTAEPEAAPNTAAPATDDLAQFSAWLKGLGTQ